MFSRLFMRPLSEGEIDSFAAMELDVAAKEVGEGMLAEGFNDMGRGLHRRHSGTRRLLATDFTMCFDGISTLHDLRAVPYASVFIGSKTGDKAELFQEPRKADKAFYAGEGIQVDESLGLPDDHLGFELSFMADLSQKAADAVRSGDLPEARRLVTASGEFRAGHILTWYGALFDLAMQIVETRFYRGVLKATFGYLELDEGLMADVDDALARLEEARAGQ